VPRRIVWCVDSPGFGGSEINLLRVLGWVGTDGAVALRGERLGPELAAFFSERGVPVVGPTGAARWPRTLSSLWRAERWLRPFGDALFVIWGHHIDSNRWLQVALALQGHAFVVVEQIVPTHASDFRRSRLSIPCKRLVAPRARRVVVWGPSQVDQYRMLFGAAARITPIVPSRDVAAIAARARQLRTEGARLRARLSLPSGPLVLSVARLAAQKDQSTLIRAVAELGAHLVLIGDGPDRGKLTKLADRIAPGRVTFAGTQDDTLPWLAAADVFAMPSRFEGLPGALIEALAAGLPCAASDIPGNRDLIFDGATGLLAPPGDDRRLAEALRRLIEDAPLAQRLAAAGQGHVGRVCDEAKEAAAWRRLFAEVGARAC
jgi:glycosyltransferase involved in cell wall biosynthesis